MRDIMNKCKEHPKLFYRYVKEKLKNKGEISKLKINDEIYKDAEEMVDMMNNCFHLVFTSEGWFGRLLYDVEKCKVVSLA